jgi:hypothetical protein
LRFNRRLPLPHISPSFLAKYREGELDLELLQAFTLTDDHSAQSDRQKTLVFVGTKKLTSFNHFGNYIGWQYSCVFESMVRHYIHDGPAAFCFEPAGMIWIDAATGASAHQEGRLAKRSPMFIRRVGVTRVDIRTRFFGHAELTIQERTAIWISNAQGWQ